jgi:hypothetical protein
MINQTDFSEFETSLPGDWKRDDNGDIYSFTVNNMHIQDERLFRELDIRPAAGGQSQSRQYALAIEEDYCSLVIDDKEFIIREISKKEDGSAYMEWEDVAGGRIGFTRVV